MRLLLLGLLTLGSCAPKHTQSGGTLFLDGGPEVARLQSVIGPHAWTGAGLELSIPEGWFGVSGGGADLEITHRASGVGLVLRVDDSPLGPLPARAGYALAFEDAQAYRAVPLLTPGGTATWSSTSGDDRLIIEYFGQCEGRTVRVEVYCPPHRTLASLSIVRTLLMSLGKARS